MGRKALTNHLQPSRLVSYTLYSWLVEFFTLKLVREILHP